MSYTATLVGKFGTSGGDAIRLYNVSPDAATGNITISDVDYAYPIGVVEAIEDHTAVTDHTTVQAKENATTTNQIDIKLWASAFAAAGTFKDFRLAVLCKETAI